jgi:hypothetical protein
MGTPVNPILVPPTSAQIADAGKRIADECLTEGRKIIVSQFDLSTAEWYQVQDPGGGFTWWQADFQLATFEQFRMTSNPQSVIFSVFMFYTGEMMFKFSSGNGLPVYIANVPGGASLTLSGVMMHAEFAFHAANDKSAVFTIISPNPLTGDPSVGIASVGLANYVVEPYITNTPYGTL